MKTTVTRTRHRAAAALAVALVVGLLACPASADDAPFTVDDGRIVGGQEVDPPGKYAFMVALVDSGSDSYYGQFCGAALIGPTWVLTAAQVLGYRTQFVLPKVWKRAAGIKPNSNKDTARTIALQLHPEADLHLKRDIGKADALLIAIFGAT